jgi:hypothetical protein
MRNLILIALLTILAPAAARAQAKQVPDAECKGLWAYTYSPWRFSKDNRGPTPRHMCMTFEGTVEVVHPADMNKDGDGDIDMRLRLDKPYEGHSLIGVEVICAEPERGNGPAATAARKSCAQFRADGRTNPYPRSYLNTLVNRHVRITGYFVIDYGHANAPSHPELHPVARITLLR